MRTTYPVLAPLSGVPDDIISPLMAGTEHLRSHMLILGEPNAQFLMPSPVARMSVPQSVGPLR